MDVNGLPMEGFPSTNLPLGVGAAPPLPADMNKDGDDNLYPEIPVTNSLTETEKEHMIFEHKDSQFK